MTNRLDTALQRHAMPLRYFIWTSETACAKINLLAFAFQDNRAFCKYLCPVTVSLKPASYFSLLRVKNDTGKCLTCMEECPKKSLHT